MVIGRVRDSSVQGRGRGWWGTVLLVPVLLVACSADPGRMPAVPDIENARDAGAVDPCALLTADQLAGIGFRPPGTAGSATEGPQCGWRGENGELTLTIFTGGAGLATLAENSEPTTTRVRVAGYPALETFTGRGEFCQYDVGVSERQVVMVALDAPAPDSCSVLQSVVAGLVQNMPPYQG